jgi:pimeloyl-ACP methyl ester carboxylesterase
MYAIRHPNRVSHLILMNSAPACRDDWLRLREELRRGRSQQDAETMSALSRTAAYQRGDLEAEADYYRAHFRATLPSPDLLERVIARLRKNFTPEGVLLARAIEQRLYQQTWMTPGFDLLPALRALDVPTLVIHGEQDLIPLDAASHIAEAVPGARLRILARCGHFAYMERLDAIRFEVQSLLSAD